MIDLSTQYLGLTLRTPLVISASPLSDSIENIRRMADAGASAIVLHSLFEESLVRDRELVHESLEQGRDSYAESLSYLPEPTGFSFGPEAYLDHIRKAKDSVAIPIIASLNGMSRGGWIDYAREIESAGADALELNIYFIPTDMQMSAAEVEKHYLEIVRSVRESIEIPIAVKLSPFFSNLAHMALQLDRARADALVLFNRFYQPDFDLEMLEVRPKVLLSTPQALRLPLRWISILYGRIQAQLAATSGIHTATDALKMLMAGAQVTMLCSVLYRHGIQQIRVIENEMIAWLQEHEYESVEQMIGSMSQKNCADPAAFERAQYVQAVQHYLH